MKKIFLISGFLFMKLVVGSTLPIIYLLHINGINTTKVEAYDNEDQLARAANINSNMVVWNVIYNPTSTSGVPLLSDIKDVIHQKAHENQIVTIDDYVNSYMQANSLNYPVNSPQYTALESQMKPIYESAFTQAAGVNFNTILNEFNQTVPSQFSSVVNLLKGENQNYQNTNAYVLLIPHSQGNLYANALIQYLTSIENFPSGQIDSYGIAVPAGQMVGGWVSQALKQLEQNPNYQPLGDVDGYITSSNDFVINGARVLWDILSSNFSIPFSITSPLGHNLISAYLGNPSSSAQIAKMLHLEAFWFAEIMESNLQANGLRLAILGSERQGGVANSSGVICDDGICNSDTLNFDNNDLEELVFNHNMYYQNTFVPDNDYPSGVYYTLTQVCSPNNDIPGVSVYFSMPLNISDNQVNCVSNQQNQLICSNNPISYNAYGEEFNCYENPDIDYIYAQLPNLFINNEFITSEFILP